MMQPASSEEDKQDQEVIKLLQDLGSFEAEYPPELLARTRAAFVARVQQESVRDQKGHSSKKQLFQRLNDLSSVGADYPPELLAARRAAFLAQVMQIEQLSAVDAAEELAPGDRQIVRLLGALKSAEADYPPDLLAARRATLLHQIEGIKNTTLLDRLRASVKSLFRNKLTIPALPLPDLMRTSLVVASLVVAALIASLVFGNTGSFLRPSPSQIPEPTRLLPTDTYLMATLLCQPGDPAPPCPSPLLDPGQDLADQVNGVARPAVSKDALSSSGGTHKAAYVNDGRSGASWVSKSADSWIKIDLGKVTTFNSVSLQKGSPGSSPDDNLGQFVIAVASSDFYSDGNSSNDYTEYAQVFNSAQTGFSGTVSKTQTVSALFPSVKARYVKITFEKANAAIDEVGVYMVQPPVLAEQPTTRPGEDTPEATLTLEPTDTLVPAESETSAPTDIQLPTGTVTASPADTLTPPASDTPTPPSTNTLPPTAADTETPVPTEPLPSDTPIPLPTVIPPTVILPTTQSISENTAPIIITGNDQTLTFTCNGNAFELRGHANTVTVFGSCSSITVIGNGNTIFWQSGSPVITNKGTENIISQK